MQYSLALKGTQGEVEQSRARIFKLLRTSDIDSTKSIPCENQFCRGIDSPDGGEGGPKKEVDSSFKIPAQRQELFFLP